MQVSRSSPPKPWEIRRSTGASNSSAALPTTPTSTTQPMSNLTTSTTTPAGTTTTNSSLSVPPRPGMTSSRPWDLRGNSSYGGSTYGSSYGSGYGSGYGSSYGSGYGSSYGSGYGSYGSGYGSSYGSSYGGYGSGYGSSYGGYGGYGSSYSPYSSRYGSGYGGYGSSYGGYGSSMYGGGYSPYGSSYGGLNRYGPPGPNGDQRYAPGLFQSMIEGGYNRMRDFGGVVEGVSRFSRLMDANFDAMHGTVGSILRMLDVAGEFLFYFKTFSVFRGFFGSLAKFGKYIRWVLFGAGAVKLVAGSGTANGIPSASGNIDFNDYMHYQNEQKRRRMLPVVMMLLGLFFVGAPMLLARMFRSIRDGMAMIPDEPQLENAWNGPQNGQPIPVQALNDFYGQNEQELTFRRDDTFMLLSKPYPDWWEGEMNGRVGLFPANLIRILENPNGPNQPQSPQNPQNVQQNSQIPQQNPQLTNQTAQQMQTTAKPDLSISGNFTLDDVKS